MNYERRKDAAFRDTLKGRAQSMRREPTLAERIMWSKLRGDQFLGLRFRRQHPIGPFIVDLYCSEKKLTVELDGDPHADQVEYDAVRTAYIVSRGLREVRFENGDVVRNIDGVLERLRAICEGEDPLPRLLPEYREKE